MNRRAVVFGGIATSLVARARAQTAARPPLVVLLMSGPQALASVQRENLLRGMRDAGQIEGRTFRFETRYADGDMKRYPGMLADAIALRPAVIVVVGLLGAHAAHQATKTIPVVLATGSDLVDAGIVASYARPGGNITGVCDLTDESAAKRLELLKAALPDATRVALLVNTEFPATPKVEARVGATAKTLGIAITRLAMHDRASMLAAIETLARARPDAILAAGDPVATTYRTELIERSTALRVPVVHYWPGSAEQGALISLQVDVDDNFRRAASYVDKILKGANPADLPIDRPSRYELIINQRAANALGLSLPQVLLLRADRVIH